MRDVTGLGELLIDLFHDSTNYANDRRYICQPGGAPANVLAALSKLGRRTALIGKTGDDELGRFLINELRNAGVDECGVIKDALINTTLAFVHLDKNGDRSFSFYRNPGADQMLNETEIDFSLIEDCTVFHMGSVSMTHEPAASATMAALRHAKSSGKMISFDPNLRLSLWPSSEQARQMIEAALGYADVVKLSQEEMLFLTEENNPELGAQRIQEQFKTRVILITLGNAGSYCRIGNYTCYVRAFKVNTVDTTGAGDSFMGAFLHKLLEEGRPPEQWSISDMKQILLFANAAAALATTRKGAINSMPGLEEIGELMGEIDNMTVRQNVASRSSVSKNEGDSTKGY